jgi:hypothetical protein
MLTFAVSEGANSMADTPEITLYIRRLHTLSASGNFFSEERPRSRRYRHTLRLLMQPCDEDENDDYFLSFSK